MELSRIEKTIYKEIEKNRKIRWSTLKRIIVDEKHPPPCSERVFRQTLNRMVEEKLVHRREISRQNVEYYVDSDIDELEKNAKEFFDVHLPEIKNLIKHIETNRSKIPIADMSGYIALLWQVANNFGFKAIILSYLSNSGIIMKNPDFEQIPFRLIELITNAKMDDMFNVMELSDGILTAGTLEMIKAIRNDLDSKTIPWTPSNRYQEYSKRLQTS